MLSKPAWRRFRIENLVTLFCEISRRNKKNLVAIPSHFNVFDVDKIVFYQISNASICMTF